MNRLAAAFGASRDPVGLLTRTGRQGDLVRLTGGKRPTYVVSSPELARRVLETSAESFLKGAGSPRLEQVMGQGLQVSEGEHHRRERALMDPGFAREPMLSHDGDVRWAAERAMAGWHDGDVLDAMPVMRTITTGAVLRAVFSEATPEDVDALTGAVTELAAGLWKGAAPGSKTLKRTVLPGYGRFDQARETIDAYVAGAVARRRSGEVAANDLLTVMLQARLGDGDGMSDSDARDEVVSLLLAGRGTITAGLTWTWFLLARHPAAESTLHAEVVALGGDGFPSAGDLDRLSYTRAVWDEALRVYPPSWVLRRKAGAGSSIDGDAPVPEGSTVLVNVIGLHRDPRSYPRPDAFEPERFLDGAQPPAFAYLPFGAGPRGCIGFHFATMEAVLVIAGIAARWRLVPEEATTGEPEFARSITLRPKRPLLMRLAAR